MAMFWILNVTGIVIGIVFELSFLMYTAVRSAVRVSWGKYTSNLPGILDLLSAFRPCLTGCLW